ncbi:DNA pilot protein [Tortoise microvirus 68]|nr:DNA pilot protein [Tortoise microvirus 68]
MSVSNGISTYTPAPANQNMIQAVNSAANNIGMMQGIAQANSAASAREARIQREWQERQNARAMAFNSLEASKSRDWQQMMSNTAHQREIQDLMAAGLNPVLSAMGGNGAAVTSGATASGVTSAGAKGDVDTSANAAITNLLGSLLSAETSIKAANINAQTQSAVADKYTAMSQLVAELNAAASMYSADSHAGASRYAADRSAAASMFGSSLMSAASKHAADQSYEASRYRANMDWSITNEKNIHDAIVKDLYGNNQYTGIFGWILSKWPIFDYSSQRRMFSKR